MKPIIISERILYLEREIRMVEKFISRSQFQPAEETFERLKKLERELSELREMNHLMGGKKNV